MRVDNQLIGQFCASLRRQGKTDSTLRMYRLVLTSIVNTYGHSITAAGMNRLIDTWLDEGKAPATINHRIVILKSFANWAETNGVSRQNSMKDVKTLKLPQQLPKPIDKEEADAVLNGIPTQGLPVTRLRRLRDKVAIAAMLCGLRVGETVNLKPSDITDQFITVMGKGGKERQAPVSTDLRDALQEYMPLWERFRNEDEEHLMISREGKQVTVRTLQRSVRRWGSDAVGKSVNAHSLRHTFASEGLRATGNLMAVSKALGHSSVVTTQIYTKVVNDDLLGLVT